jgi:hypothetical protein
VLAVESVRGQRRWYRRAVGLVVRVVLEIENRRIVTVYLLVDHLRGQRESVDRLNRRGDSQKLRLIGVDIRVQQLAAQRIIVDPTALARVPHIHSKGGLVRYER